MSIRLALIGQNISHSKSEQMYRKILKSNFSYELLDFDSGDKIPSLETLFLRFKGISITAPYKKHFLDLVELDEKTKNIGAINCIKFDAGKYYGFNTDYLAIEEIIKENNYLDKEIIILGDGAMANVLCLILQRANKNYKSLSRKKDGDIKNIDLSQYPNLLVINCCGRAFNYVGSILKESVFWDLNYSHIFHKENLAPKCIYVDGEELLHRQACHATKIWGIE